MSAIDDVPAELVDGSGVIVADVACRQCGYNLHGLRPTGRCPECGAPAGLSCHGDLLRYCDPGWLGTLARGARIIIWGLLASIVVDVLGAAVGWATGAIPIANLIRLLGGLVGRLVGVYGAWLITEPDPSGIGEDRYVTDRRIVRVALLVGVCSSVLSLIEEALPLLPGAFMVVFSGVLVASRIVVMVGEFAKLTYFRKLALRIPDAVLAGWAARLRWAVAVFLGLLIVGGGLLSLAWALDSRGGGTPPMVLIAPAACVFVAAVLGYLIVAILILILVYRLGKAFAAQAEISRQTWASALSDTGG